MSKYLLKVCNPDLGIPSEMEFDYLSSAQRMANNLMGLSAITGWSIWQEKPVRQSDGNFDMDYIIRVYSVNWDECSQSDKK